MFVFFGTCQIWKMYMFHDSMKTTDGWNTILSPAQNTESPLVNDKSYNSLNQSNEWMVSYDNCSGWGACV